MGKPISVAQVLKAVKLLAKHGLRPYVYLMYGVPFMTRETYRRTIDVVKKLYDYPVEKITLYKYVRLPGTGFENIEFSIKGCEDLVKRLKTLVYRFNSKKKEEFLNRKLEVFLVYSRGKYYGYPVKHGPVVYVKGLEKPGFDGCRALVRIYDVGPRNLWGLFEKIVSCQ